MQQRRKLLAAAAVFAAAALVTACGSDASSDNDGQVSSIDVNRTVRIGYHLPAASWDPAKDTSTFVYYMYAGLVYDRLLYLAPDATLAPMLATEWRFDDSSTTLTMRLREDVKFHDGSKFDANVAVANLERSRSEGMVSAPSLANVSSVAAETPNVLVIKLKAPDPAFLFALAQRGGFMVSSQGLAAGDAALSTTPQGSGPYKLKSVTANLATFELNPNYWADTSKMSKTKEIVAIEDDAARLNALRSGELDFAILRSQFNEARNLVRSANAREYAVNSGVVHALYLNLNSKGADNPELRKALNMAVDRAGINQALFDGTCKPVSTMVPLGFAGADDSLRFEYNPETAKKMVADSGNTGLSLETVQLKGHILGTVALALKDQLGKVGVTLDLKPVEASVGRQEWRSKAYDAAVISLTSTTADGISTMSPAVTGPDNPAGPPPGLKDMVAKASALPLGKERTDAISALNKSLFENPIMVPICQTQTYFLADRDVVGLDQLSGAQLNSAVDTRFLGTSK
jgi:ABC-type transport system substrate-binding protein